MTLDTIYALSSGAVPSGVAIVRLSGPAAGQILRGFIGELPEPRRATLSRIVSPADGRELDRGIVLWFPSPHSFTGEDVAELHLHGSRAVLHAIFDSLAKHSAVRLAEAGEFSRRAFWNDRLDLTQVEGVSDLIAAETEMQRRQALGQTGGTLRVRAEAWRRELIGIRAGLEAQLDFSDEDDVPLGVDDTVWVRKSALQADMRTVLEGSAGGERLRDGFRVALLGAPNAGKSTLLNALACRDIAIVTEEPGTTRDVMAVPLDIGGYPVTVFDTAGIRDTESLAEREGVRRAGIAAQEADLVLWLEDLTRPSALIPGFKGADVWRVGTKVDLADRRPGANFAISASTGLGMDTLLDAIRAAAEAHLGNGLALVTRERQRLAISDAVECLTGAEPDAPPEVAADLLRGASDAIARLSGRTDIEDVLDRLFGEFCIGK